MNKKERRRQAGGTPTRRETLEVDALLADLDRGREMFEAAERRARTYLVRRGVIDQGTAISRHSCANAFLRKMLDPAPRGSRGRSWLQPLCVGGGEARGRLSSRVSDSAQARFSRAFSAPGCGIASLYAAREAAYAGIASPPDVEAEDSSLRPRRPARGEWSFVRRGIGIHNRSPHRQPQRRPIPPRLGQTPVAAGAASRTLSTSSGRRRSHRRQPDPSDDRTAFCRCAPALGAAGEQRARGSRPAQSMRSLTEAPDTCWDRLRQRRARREAGLEPGAAPMRDESVVESYEQ